MSLDKLLVTIAGIFGIALTYWFFLLKKEKVIEVKEKITITVDGGYVPETISIPKNKTTSITLIRKDANPCLEEVILSDFNIKKYLPMNKKVKIDLTPKKTGEYKFSCGMGMFHGKLIVK